MKKCDSYIEETREERIERLEREIIEWEEIDSP
jgi:hypothetical protein